jgi:hypothetical protein
MGRWVRNGAALNRVFASLALAAHDRLTEANPAIIERASPQGSNRSSLGQRPHMLANQIDHTYELRPDQKYKCCRSLSCMASGERPTKKI